MLTIFLTLSSLIDNFHLVAAQPPVPENILVQISQVDVSDYPLITLFIRVYDENGVRVPELTQDQIIVTEDEESVEIISFSGIDQVPIKSVLAIDNSGSMQKENKLKGAKDSALAFIDMMRTQDEIALILFDNVPNILLDFTNDQEQLRSSIQDLTAAGGTALFDAIISSTNQLSPISGRKSLILLSDGKDEHSKNNLDDAVEAAKLSGAPIYVIGLGSSENLDENSLQRFANVSGGEYYHSPTSEELHSLYRQIAQSTQEEYVLSYRSPRPEYDGTRRDISIQVGNEIVDQQYTEKHLLHIKSNLLVGMFCLIPLFAAVIIPIFWFQIRRNERESEAISPVSSLPHPVPHQVTPTPEPVENELISQCQNCGQSLRLGAQFCPYCGSVISPSQVLEESQKSGICQKCGHSLRPNTKFCSKCGTQVI
jgi:VWFA-related protein